MTNLTRALRSLLSSTATSYPGSLESLYTSTEALVSVAHQGSDLYDRVKLEMERAVGDIARELRAEASTEGKFSGKAWLIKLEETWTGWCNRMVSLVLEHDGVAPESGGRRSPVIWTAPKLGQTSLSKRQCRVRMRS